MNNSMINPSIVELLDKVDNRYSLVIVTAKRARQLIQGDTPKVKVDSNKPLTIAINEVNTREIVYETVKEGIK
jgi:DNA-directed RNA polymerase subunit omega